MAGTKRSGRRTKYAMMRLRELQEEKVKEAERAFAILVEISQMETLPKDWSARQSLCNDVMNRVWGTPKARSEITGKDGAPQEIALVPVNYRTGLEPIKPSGE